MRTIEFGPLERHTIGHDFRRTDAVEAIAGDAKVEQVAHAMGNTLSASNALFATYVPGNVTTLSEVRMPRKTARSGSQTPLGRSGMLGAIHPLASALPASSENAYHPRQFWIHLGNPGWLEF